MTTAKKQRTRQEVIWETWSQIGSESAGARELNLIQQAMAESFGRGAVESPARLARNLADAGVQLRHPEVLEADSVWRESRIYELFGPGELDFATLDVALESVGKLEDLRLLLVAEGDEAGVKSLMRHVRELKTELVGGHSELGKEVGQWFTVWLQNPQIFGDWLSLRRNSPDFVAKFGPGVR